MGYYRPDRPTGRVRVLLGVVALALAILGPGVARAQQAEPLSKSDVVRLLAEPTYSADEVTAIVRRSCLNFKPTADDMSDFQRLGATEATLSAIRQCAASGPRRTQPSPAAAAARLEISPDTVTARVGEPVAFSARVLAGDRPVTGLTLVAVGSGQIPGGAVSDIAAVTNSSGTADFRMTAGRTPGDYPMHLQAVGRTVGGAASVLLRVSAGAPARVTVRPDTVTVGPGQPDTTRILVSVRDTFDNLVPGAPVTLRLPAPAERAHVWSDTSDASGSVTLRFPTTVLRPGDEIAVSAGGRPLARLPVAGPAGVRTAGARIPADSLAALRTRAASLLQSGQAAQAAEVYGAILDARPDDPQALVGRGRALAASGQVGVAEQTLERAITADATNVAARRELGRVQVEAGRPSDAVSTLQEAVQMAPDDAEAWAALGDAYLAAEQPSAARDAYQRALGVRPDLAEAKRGIERARDALAPLPPYMLATVWGGYTNTNGRPFGPRRAELHLWTSRNVELWGRYDNALNLDRPELVRGEVDIESFWGGGRVFYGPANSFGTGVELGRRKLAPLATIETVWTLDQTVYVGEPKADPFLRPEVRVSGTYGHWYDENDWLVVATGGIPAGPYVRVEPRVSYGDLAGSASALDRVQSKDARFGLGAWIRPAPGWRIEPFLTVGHVKAPPGSPAALTGSLFDASLRVLAPVVREAGLDLFIRYQSPPGRKGFVQMGVGLTGIVPRS